jgi:hypothetical protein
MQVVQNQIIEPVNTRDNNTDYMFPVRLGVRGVISVDLSCPGLACTEPVGLWYKLEY